MNHIKLKTNRDPSENARFLGKIIRDNNRPPSSRAAVPNIGVLNNISAQTEEAINDYKYIKELLTEVKLIQELFISSVTTSAISKNLNTIEYNIKMPENGYTNKIYGSMLAVVADYFKNTYKIADIIPDILLKSLFEQGSAPYLILPESSLDTMIGNAVSLESADDINTIVRATIAKDKTMYVKGYLGKFGEKTADFSFESETLSDGTTIDISELYLCKSADLKTIVIDNYDILKRPALVDRHRERAMAKTIVGSMGVSLESADDKETPDQRTAREQKRTELIAKVFQSTKGHKRIDSLPIVHHEDNSEYGEPTPISLPAGAVIPIHPPGDPLNPEGFIVIVDESGRPIDTSAYVSYYKQQRSRNENGNAITSALRNAASVAGIANSIGGGDVRDLDTLAECYSTLVEQDIIRRCENGLYGSVEMGGNKAEVGRIMLARLLKNQRTMLLFIPANLMVYYAFDYNDYGIGESLIEQTKMLSVMRINTMLANAIAVQRNAVGTTTISIKLSDQDMEPRKTVQEIVGEHMYNRTNGMNLMSTDPLTSYKQMQRSGIQVAVSGNPNYPDTEVSITDSNGQRAVVDEAFMEDQRRRWLMGFGLIPEMVDQSTSLEFAAQVYSQNAMFGKRVAAIKSILGKHCTKHVRTHTMFSSTLRMELIKVIQENFTEIAKEFKDTDKTTETLQNDIMMDFIANLMFVFPDLSSTTSQQLMDDFNAKKQLVEAAVEQFISLESLPPEMLGLLSEKGIDLTMFGKRIVSSIMRGYIRENNLSPQLAEIGNKEDDSYLTEMFDEILSHEGAIRSTLLDFISAQTKNLTDFNEDAQKKIDKLEAKVGPIVEGVVDGAGEDDYSGGSPAPETNDSVADDDWASAGFSGDEEEEESLDEENQPDENSEEKTDPNSVNAEQVDEDDVENPDDKPIE